MKIKSSKKTLQSTRYFVRQKGTRVLKNIKDNAVM